MNSWDLREGWIPFPGTILSLGNRSGCSPFVDKCRPVLVRSRVRNRVSNLANRTDVCGPECLAHPKRYSMCRSWASVNGCHRARCGYSMGARLELPSHRAPVRLKWRARALTLPPVLVHDVQFHPELLKTPSRSLSVLVASNVTQPGGTSSFLITTRSYRPVRTCALFVLRTAHHPCSPTPPRSSRAAMYAACRSGECCPWARRGIH